MKNANDTTAHFVCSHDFSGDADYIDWLQEIKDRYRSARGRVALQANYGALEFNWLLGRDIVMKKAESRWGDGVVDQLSLDLKAAFPDVKGFSSRNLYYMKRWYEFYCATEEKRLILHQLGAELQTSENKNPIKLHQLGAEIVSDSRLGGIFERNEMLPVFGIVPWKHHVYIASHCKTQDLEFIESTGKTSGLSYILHVTKRKSTEDKIDYVKKKKQDKARQKEAILRYLDSIETINNREARALLNLQEKDRSAVSRLFAELVAANEIVQTEDSVPKNVKYRRIK